MGWAELNVCSLRPAHPANGAAGAISLAFNTAENGDIVVTLTPDAEVSAHFRSSGFEGTRNNMKILSGTNFATEENLSEYFSMKNTISGNTCTFYRTGTKNLPSPCKLKIDFSQNALAWVEGAINAYDNNGATVIQYNYGTLCGSTLDAPSISVNSDGEISFDAIEGADSYKAYVYFGSQFIKECPVTSGQKVWNPYLAGEYAIYVRAFNSSTDAYSDFSNGEIWDAVGDPSGDMPKSDICGYYLKEGTNEEALLSFYTDRSTGNFYITLSAGENGDDSKTFFRDAGGLSWNGFTYDGIDMREYFTRIPEDADDINGKVNVLTFVPRTEEGHIPAYNHTIAFASGNYVTWRTYNNGTSRDSWQNNLSFSYVYGTNCNEIDDHVAPVVALTKVSTTTTSATLQIDVTEKDDYNEDRALRSLTIRDAANSFAEQKVTLNGSNQVTLSELNKNTIYNFTVKAVDSGGNVTEETIKVPLTFDPYENLALNKDCSAGGYENNDHKPSKANDGNNTTSFWGTYGCDGKVGFVDWPTANTWEVDLEQAYVLDSVSVYRAELGGGNNRIMTLKGKMNESDEWSTIFDDLSTSLNTSYRNVPAVASARYLQFSFAGTSMIAVNEFEVYGHDYAVPDAVAPVVAVSEISKTYNTVTLQINATDKDDAGNPGTINAINISGDNGFVTQNNVELEENQITLSGLHYNKTYTFAVQVIDLAGNETIENIEVILPFNTNYNIALDGTASAGYWENDSQTADKANDGSTSTKWNTYGVETDKAEYTGTYANNWWMIQLDAAYNLSRVVANYQDVGTRDFIIEGSMDGSNWYVMYKGQTTAAGEFSYDVAAPAQYVRYTYGERYLAVYEFEVYASGFSTLTDDAPVITWAKLGAVDDATAEIEIDAADITTKPITTYVVTGIGEDPIEVTASEGKITLTSLSQSTHYTLSIQAKDGDNNLSEAKQMEFTTAGSVSGLYFFSDYFNWNKTAEAARFSTTAEPGVLSVTIPNMTAGGHIYKLYNAGADRCTRADCSGTTDHHFANAMAKNVTFYATDEDHFICTEDALYLRGTLVGEDQALVWNDAHTVATWTGALDLTGTKQFNVVKKNVVGETTYTYTQDFYAEAQTFDGDYTYGTFTLDLTKMTGTWGYVELEFLDNGNNTDLIAENADRVANIIINRPILANNAWYTLCVPFDMSADKVSEVFGSSTIAELTGAEDRGSLIHLNFSYVNAMVAGHAYLIMPGQDFTAGSTISGVTIKNVDPEALASQTEYMHFQGTFNKIMLEGENKRFMGANNYVYSPRDGGTPVGAFRCFFTIPDNAPANVKSRPARIVFGEQTATGMENISAHPAPAKFMLDGVLYIIRDGRTYNAQGQLVK